MKKLLLSLSLSLLLSVTALAQFNKNIVIAHRGAWKTTHLPENSIASLNHAIALGCHATEFDVHMTADSILVVNHDHEFYGLDIEKSTYAQLLEKKHPNGEAIPTLEAYLREGMKQKKTKLIVEVKTSQISEAHALTVAEKAHAIVTQLKAEKWVEYICFSWEVGKRLHQLDKKAKIAYLEGDKTPAEAKAAGYTGLDYHFSVYSKNPTWIAEAHKLGLTVNAWTVNTRADMQTLINHDVEYITTNEPELLFEVLKEKE
ncbi:glycerophosphodiester phosphodiesterase [Flavobacterium akiainvivens]|uniref:Glycerophosphodiester phosphodiesterase n=1 Tax=Flavobacterium akiainvivens TaxID=1202724 RepID=A0A0M9VIY5_9FLAO|nr:glycerophosphodiester phosphodiesterase family protein [Flavobacterium akiainvivens]KOS07139.1 glycerophosphodiester phosphodiesterase [Flavobacterium akiainvivens]SFQ73274.1 glycerophosphoryl diester phosphodiesterase [Flavobacterium akiainvivens]